MHASWRKRVTPSNPLNPFGTAVPFWGQTSLIPSDLSPKRDWGPKTFRNAGPFRGQTTQFLSNFPQNGNAAQNTAPPLTSSLTGSLLYTRVPGIILFRPLVIKCLAGTVGESIVG